MSLRILSLLLLATLALLAPTHAQSVQQKVVIFHDVSGDGYTYTGTPTQFAFALLNQDGSPNVHKNGRVVVKQNDVTLYETLGYATAHDYDALNPFLVTFPVEGRYTIEAEIPVTGDMLKASFEGYVERRDDLVPVTIRLEAPARTTAGALTKLTYQVLDANDTLVRHSDGLIEIRNARDERLLFRTHTHSHGAPQMLEYVFPQPGTYTLRIIAFQAYPEKSGTAFAPTVITQPITVAQASSQPVLPTPPSLTATVPASQAPTAKQYRLHATYDPDRTVGMSSNMRLNTYVYDPATGDLVPHVDFAAVLKDPDGRILFQSSSLHEYDGHLEILTANARTGTYQLEVKAHAGDWSDARTLVYDVAPPLVRGASANPAFGAGPLIVTSKGLDKLTSGTPQQITFTASTLGGAPWQHSEIDLQVTDTKGVPIYLNKLHTHGDGLFTVAVNFPQPGDYKLILDATPVHQEVSTGSSYGKLGDSIIVPVKVAPGVDIPSLPVHDPIVEAKQTPRFASGANVVAFLALLGACLGFMGRRP